MQQPANCPGCGAAPGTDHADDPDDRKLSCDWACCPECGEQLTGCSDHAGSTRPARWNGIAPGKEAARKLGWWTTATGIDHLVEDHARVLFARVLGQITWNPQAQRYDIGHIDETAIDEAGRNARPPYIR